MIWKRLRANLQRTAALLVGTGTLYLLYAQRQRRESRIASKIKQRSRERYFLKFASLEYGGQVYMTPIDFLESVLEVDPRIRRNRKLILSPEYLEHIKRTTPGQGEGSPRFFSQLGDNGIISYTDYMFLLTILTKQFAAVKIGFKMLDRDNNNTIDKTEYLVLERVFSREWKTRRGIYNRQTAPPPITEEEYVDDEAGLQRKHEVDTTLMIHFFGKDGSANLAYNLFKNFIRNLQREILELEFAQFSHGLPMITQLDFAKLLIRYTYLEADYDYDSYIERLLSRAESRLPQQGITFEEFASFMRFLKHLDEFYYAIRFYTQINPTMSRLDFHDAFQMLPNHNLTFHIIETVFDIFDVDGTGLIDYKDFIRVINDRQDRGGFKHPRERSVWFRFGKCVKRATGGTPDISFYRKTGT